MPPALSRRRLLGLGGALAVSAVAGGCSATGQDSGGLGLGGREGATCVPRSSLDSHRTLAGLPLVYEVDRRRTAFRFDGAFFTQLESWAGDLAEVLPSRPQELSTYGSWTDGGSACDSWHNAGRALDVARLTLADGSAVSCRYDQWRSLGGIPLEEARRRYWALAAGLHQRFAYVLTYLYNAQHANHIHVDNGRSGPGGSAFSSRSAVQVQAVQALCTYLWEEPVELTGRWDAGTRTATGRVLDRLGLEDTLDAADSWSGFLGASVARGRD
jgi:Extensin-like protein C-terminus